MRSYRRAMQHRQVVAFHEVLGKDLPVGIPHVLFIEGFDVVGHAVCVDESAQFGELRMNGRRVLVERHVDPALPFLTTHGGQLVAFLAEARLPIHHRCPAQRAIERIIPRMVRAHDPAHIAASFKQHRHTMQAHIRHRLELHLLVAQDHDRLCADACRQIVAGRFQRACAADALPFAFEDIALFQRQEFCRRIDTRRHGVRFAERPFATGLQRLHQPLQRDRPCGACHGTLLDQSLWERVNTRHCGVALIMVRNLSSQIASQNIVFGYKGKLLPMQRAQLRRRFRHSTSANQIMRRHADAVYRFRRTTRSAARLAAASSCAIARCLASSR